MARYSYSSYDGGPDPLAPPVDTAAAIDSLSDAVLDGADTAEALRELLRRGVPDRSGSLGVRGLGDLAARARRRQRELARSGRLDGLLRDVQDLLDEALTHERATLAADGSEDARWREHRLAELPDDTAAAVRDLSDYDWRSAPAREAYDRIRQRLRRDVVDQQFQGLANSLATADDDANWERLSQLLTDLNDLLERHRDGTATQADLERFLDRHPDAFPDRPESLDDLVDQLARRAAAMQRLLDSLSPDQRQQLADLVAATQQDLGVQAQLAQLADLLRGLRPDLPWQGRQRVTGDRSLSLPDATGVLTELADLAELADQLDQGRPGAALADVDEELVRRTLGREAGDDLARLRELADQLRRQGFLTERGDRLELSPAALRRIGRAALNRVFASLAATARGDHDVADAGAAGEFTGASRPWRFGDEQPIDAVRTVSNALLRHGSRGRSVRLEPGDIEVRETETRTRAAVALLVDRSYSMVINDTWLPAKTTALALHTLAASAYPLDALQIIAFANTADVVAPHDLPALPASEIQGTNLQHALLLAGRFLDRHRDAEPVVMVVTDGEPTAQLLAGGSWWFDWPPDPETVAVTVAEIDRLTRRGVAITWFRLGDEPRLARFLDDMARRNGGRVIAATGDRLGGHVVTDYVRRRRGRARARGA